MGALVPWRDILADALDRGEVIGVTATVRTYLGREPTRSEITAARRAANNYAAAGQAQVIRVPARPGRNGDRKLLLLARPGAESDDEDHLRELGKGQPVAMVPRRGHVRSAGQTARGIARTVAGASAAVPLIDVERIKPNVAEEVAASLDLPLRDLVRFRHRLVRRAAAQD